MSTPAIRSWHGDLPHGWLGEFIELMEVDVVSQSLKVPTSSGKSVFIADIIAAVDINGASLADVNKTISELDARVTAIDSYDYVSLINIVYNAP